MQAIQEHADAPSPRERILAAARKIFLDGPPEHATMDAVAQQAGMSKKTIYREFKSQLELLGALLAENVADMGQFPPPRSSASPVGSCAPGAGLKKSRLVRKTKSQQTIVAVQAPAFPPGSR